ncbi:SMI1/KNR4 family protein [Streptomyces sp. NPDC005283]|uniref:SMI1/KNR4 family protein n=1 Tax=Streptomyces sp. NPDC005283 TaxID=3156871 RepID=UPI0034535E06
MSSNDDQLAQVEHHFGVRFPQDYRDFLGTTGSLSQFVPPADDFLVIDALHELIGINEAGEFQKRFPGAVVIGGDGSRELLAYDFRQDTPLLVTLDVSAEDWSSAIHQAIRPAVC